MSSGQAKTGSGPKKKYVPRPLRSCLRFLLIYAMVPHLAITGFFATLQRWLIYHPARTTELKATSISLPGVKVDDVEIPIDAQLTLHGWRFQSAVSVPSDRRFLVIYFGGNAGSRADRAIDCRDFTQIGCDVLLFDYRGYADNKGTPGEAHMAADARRVWAFAHDKLHFASKRIVIFGESLGGAVSTRLASEQSIAGDPPAALILNSTFSSLVETAAWHYPFLPVRLLLIDRFPSIDRIPSVTCPLLQFHGTADRIVPLEQGQRLFQAAPNKASNGIEKQFVKVAGADHNMISVDQMQASIKKLLDRIP